LVTGYLGYFCDKPFSSGDKGVGRGKAKFTKKGGKFVDIRGSNFIPSIFVIVVINHTK
jgi:hypothetical protein